MRPETIIAPATPEGRSAIAVLRMSGPDALTFLAKLFRPARPVDIFDVPSGRLVYGFLEWSGRIIDEVVVGIFRAPRSYTREDMVEIYCHGNPLIVDEITKTFLSIGAKMAERGEFTLRAFLNGRMDLTQAEAVMSLISASSKIGVEVGLNQLLGGLRRELEEIRAELLGVLTELEARINFPEDVGADVELSGFIDRLDKVEQKVLRMLSGAELYQGIEAGVKVAIVGYPNVGKSSLFNAILREERAIVYDLKGTTRDVITERFPMGDFTVVLMDTAGIMDEAEGVDRIAVEKTRRFIESAWVVILVLEAGRELNDVEKRLLDELKAMNKQIIIFVNKVDLAKGWEMREDFGVPIVYGCSWDEESIGRLLEELGRALEEIKAKRDDMYVLREFQRNELQRVLESVRLAREYLVSGEEVELVSAQLQLAMESLDRIEGKSFDEELLTNIFQEFCIGK